MGSPGPGVEEGLCRCFSLAPGFCCLYSMILDFLPECESFSCVMCSGVLLMNSQVPWLTLEKMVMLVPGAEQGCCYLHSVPGMSSTCGSPWQAPLCKSLGLSCDSTVSPAQRGGRLAAQWVGDPPGREQAGLLPSRGVTQRLVLPVLSSHGWTVPLCTQRQELLTAP